MTIRRRKPLRPRAACKVCRKSLCGHGREIRLRKSRVNPINRERRDREWARAYGSVERVEAVRAMRCCVPGCNGLSENAHITTGGMGRKADADKVANLCRGHHRTRRDSLHNLGSVEAFRRAHGVDLVAVAERLAA